MSTPTQTVRITHSWCPTCQNHPKGKARCSTPRDHQGIWPAGVREQACVVCEWMQANLPCEWC